MSYRKFVPRAEEFNPHAIHLLDKQINQQLHGIPHILTLLHVSRLIYFFLLSKNGGGGGSLYIRKENGVTSRTEWW